MVGFFSFVSILFVGLVLTVGSILRGYASSEKCVCRMSVAKLLLGLGMSQVVGL